MGGRIGVATHFDARAERYDLAYAEESADGHALRSRLEAVLSFVGPGPGEVLDVGMGPGRLVAELDVRGWTVSGVDVSQEMVRVARTRVPAAASRLQRGSIEQLPFGDASFDAVVATGVLEYTDVSPALSELARVLKPGGTAVVSYPRPWSLYGTWKSRLFYPAVRLAKRAAGRSRRLQPHGAGAISVRAFEGLLRRAGLTPRAVAYTSSIPVVSPFDLAFPRLTARLARAAERRGRLARTCLATQAVFHAERNPAR